MMKYHHTNEIHILQKMKFAKNSINSQETIIAGGSVSNINKVFFVCGDIFSLLYDLRGQLNLLSIQSVQKRESVVATEKHG